ncbi:MAG: hypothetical protein ACYTGL_13445 [Planctomycetota bacterium]|jgi:hypothetical protein
MWFSKQRTFRVVIGTTWLALCLSGCGYPEVSPKTYEVASALYAASNRQSLEHIEKSALLIDELRETEEITERESEWLKAIVEQARAEQWTEAAAEARVLIADQVRESP